MHVSVFLILISTLAASLPETEPRQTPDGIGTTVVWIGPDGQPLPFQTHQQIRDFLHTATVLKIQDIPVGVTKPRKVLLEKDGIQVNSCFKTVDIHKDIQILFFA